MRISPESELQSQVHDRVYKQWQTDIHTEETASVVTHAHTEIHTGIYRNMIEVMTVV